MKKLINAVKFLLFYPLCIVLMICVLGIVTVGMIIYLSKELWGVLNYDESEFTNNKGLNTDCQKALRVQEEQNQGRAQTFH